MFNLSTIVDTFKTKIIQQVIWAETNLKGKTGAEKRKAVVDAIDAAIVLPAWLEPFDGPIIGVIVDLVCDRLNLITKNDFAGLVLSDKQTEEIANSLDSNLKGVEALTGGTTEERIESLNELTNECPETGKED